MRKFLDFPEPAPRADSAAGVEAAHRRLAAWNRRRLRPGLPDADWRAELAEEAQMRAAEAELTEAARAAVAKAAAEAPRDAEGFVDWFAALEKTGPGQHDPLFDWLEAECDLDRMRWFVAQEISGEAGFEDLTAYAQVQIPERAKLEMARNYWDEMGRGNPKGMHGPMLARLGEYLGVEARLDETVLPAVAMSNIMTALATNRRYAFHAIGALGVIELTAPARAAKVTQALKRLNVPARARQYFAVHAVLDVKHSQEWNAEVLAPLVAEDPARAPALAEGALMRLAAGAACFDAYRAHFRAEGAEVPAPC